MTGRDRAIAFALALAVAVVALLVVETARGVPPGWQPPGWWARQAACIRAHEGWWTANTGNGYYGAYQFLHSTWRSVGGTGYPHQATPREQTYRAWLLWRANGQRWAGQWGTAGVCGAQMTATPATRRVNRGRGHSYLLDGAPVVGVTTVLSEGYPKPGLINWAFDTASQYAIDHWDELAELGPGSRLAKIQKARYQSRDEAAVRGTAVHELAQRLQAGEEVEPPEHLIGHVDAYLAFVRDWQPVELMVEAPVFSREYLYAGTVDLVADLADALRWLLDWKTSKGSPYPEVALQLAAYRYSDFTLGDAGDEIPMPRVDRCGVVWLRADGYDLIPIDAGPEAFTAFGHVQQVARFRADPREAWVGETLQPPEQAAV